MTDGSTRRVAVLAEGRRADSDRRRQRVLAALARATSEGDDLTLSAVARRAGVDRTFFYRHPDLLEQLRSLQTEPTGAASTTTVSRVSLQADLHAAQHRAARFAARVQLLERRLSEMMGEQVWRGSGLGAPEDIDGLHQRVASLEAELADTRIQLDERNEELVAARLANRELMAHVNAPRTSS
jgi:Family of unknown function (DUF6262)